MFIVSHVKLKFKETIHIKPVHDSIPGPPGICHHCPGQYSQEVLLESESLHSANNKMHLFICSYEY